MGEQQSLDQALQDFRRVTEVALTRIEGQGALLLQRQEQVERRADVQDGRLTHLDTRLDLVERTAVTRDDLDKRDQAAQVAMDKRANRTIAWSGLIVTVVGVLTGTGTSVIIALVNHK